MIVKKHTLTKEIIVLIAGLLFILNVILGIYLLEDRIQAEKKLVVATGMQISQVFNNEISLRENSIEILRSSSRFYLDDEISLNEDIIDFITPNSEKEGYLLKGITGFMAAEAGSLTGLGPVPVKGSFLEKEISMAVSLSPVFNALINKDPDTPWVYYTSLGGFIYIYPRIDPDEFFFSTELYEKDFIKSGLPQHNPDKEIYWSPIYMDEAGKGLMTTVSAPVYYGNRYIGSVSIDVHVDKLEWLLGSYSINNTSNHLVNSLGNDVLDPNYSFIDVNIDELKPGVLYTYGDGWISVYDLNIQNWKILLLTERKEVFGYAVEKTLPVFFIILLFSGTLVLLYLLFTALKKVELLSTKDSLTGVWNRHVFENEAEQRFAGLKRQGIEFSLIFIDIDNFKLFNDTYGHSEGDRILRTIAVSLDRSLERGTDRFFRVGGEEFAVLTLSATEPELSSLMEKLRYTVYGLQITHEGSPAGWVTISLGGYIVDRNKNDAFIDAYRKSDKALYESKSRGKNCFTLYHD